MARRPDLSSKNTFFVGERAGAAMLLRLFRFGGGCRKVSFTANVLMLGEMLLALSLESFSGDHPPDGHFIRKTGARGRI